MNIQNAGSLSARRKAIDIADHFEKVVELPGTDAEIASAVQEAEIAPLLAALFVLSGERALIADDLVPPLPPLGAAGAPQGGMSEAALTKGRALATAELIKARQNGWPRMEPAPDLLRDAFKYLTKNDDKDFTDMLSREFRLPVDRATPAWQKSELAPSRQFKVAVIGAGLAGVAAAYRLSQANVPFVVLEKSSRPGGVWNDNRYPGCRLDTPNFAYGFSFAPKSDWPQAFSQQKEILNYIDTVLGSAELSDSFEFDTEVVRMTYDPARGGWSIAVRQPAGEKTLFADVVISAVGHLNRPSIPSIPGQESFSGRAFHSAEWPSDVDVKGKRVAVLGTGASGFQIVPAIADRVDSLTVFQRTPSWILSTPNYYDDIRPGMRRLLASVPYYGRWFRLFQFVMALDARFPAVAVDPDWKHPISVSALNEKLRQECLSLLAQQCGDRLDLLQKLTPNYAPGSKRMVRDNGAYVRALKQPNVSLVTEAVASLTPTGVVTSDGVHHDVDILVYATGFHASSYMAPIEVVGENGIPLHEFWEGDCRAYLGISVPNYPNLFIIGGPNSGLVVNGNAIVTTEYSLQFVMSSIEYMLREGAKSVDLRPDVYDAYNLEIDRENRKRTWGVATVNTWYQGKNGRPAVPWPYPIIEYFRRTAHFDPGKYVVRPVR
ncbi:flavin-containing monooxygenase [Bradyrhizobium vignae]|uniref:Putative flavin-containing monooxygenase n=1 Tax=Bradyrhizobium vignae TaxID=1549949 RepID=A0A2U3PUY0_9BRAD|nr:NAD(P)/FAD-dependent oxidoreductase [Bradyrhizobium vignae]SPP92926.1 putative flavin-containing monooxygenase [Bradyrhizobium vignae]